MALRNEPQRRIRFWSANVVIGLVLAFRCSFADEPTEAQKAAIARMHDEMAKIKFVVVQDKGKESVAELKAEPILRYTDPQRAFPDAALWVWTIDGRPAGFSKIERMQNGTQKSWQYCVTSISDDKLVLRWPDGIAWKSRKAALKFQKLPYDEAPQKTAQLRLVQLRNLSRRFRASTVDNQSNPEEMRLLAQPIFRYSNADQGLVDGAVFGLVSNGTNPDSLLMVQVRQDKDSKPIWEYGCIGMTGDKVTFQMDDKTVYEHVGAQNPGDHGHWLWLVLRD